MTASLGWGSLGVCVRPSLVVVVVVVSSCDGDGDGYGDNRFDTAKSP